MSTTQIRPSDEKPAGKVPTRKERTRAAILAAAANCFREHGFAGCSVDGVAEAAGVTKPTVYAHFESKERLFDELLQASFAAFAEEPLTEAHSLADVEETLRAHAKEHIEQYLAEDVLGLFRAVVAELMRRPEWAQELFGSFPEQALPTWLKQTARAGLLDVKNADAATDTFWGLVKGPLFYPVLLGLRPRPTRREQNRVVAEAVRVFLAGHRAN